LVFGWDGRNITQLTPVMEKGTVKHARKERDCSSLPDASIVQNGTGGGYVIKRPRDVGRTVRKKRDDDSDHRQKRTRGVEGERRELQEKKKRGDSRKEYFRHSLKQTGSPKRRVLVRIDRGKDVVRCCR